VQQQLLFARASHLFKQAINLAQGLLARLLEESRAGYKRVIAILGRINAHGYLLGAMLRSDSLIGSVVARWLGVGKMVEHSDQRGSVVKTQIIKGDDILKS
jgi:hypothetical protein